MTETASDLVRGTALQDSVLSLVLLIFVVGVGVALRAVWRTFVIPVRDAAVKYLERQAAAMESQGEAMRSQGEVMRGLNEEIRELRRDIGS